MSEEFEQDLLEYIARLIVVANVAPDELEDLRVIAAHQRLERILIARDGLAHQDAIGRHVLPPDRTNILRHTTFPLLLVILSEAKNPSTRRLIFLSTGCALFSTEDSMMRTYHESVMSIGKNGMAGRAREGLFPFVPQGFGLFHLE